MQQAKSNIFSFVLYLLGFLLFWEWLRPMTVIANTENIGLFVGFSAFSFFLSYLRLPFWVTLPVKGIAILFAMHVLFFFNSSITDPLWLRFLLADTKKNIIFLFNGNWDGLTNVFRSLLFFVLLWIVSYLMHYWLIQTRKLFLFFFMTVVYLSVLDTFTMYHADVAIVRTMIIGLILLGLLRVVNVQEEEKVSFDKGRLPFQWILALVCMIAFTAVAGFAAPKTGPHWPDPVPFITKAQNGYSGDTNGSGKLNLSGRSPQKIGYDSNDTHLGGSFINDNTTVFTAYSNSVHYWRIDSKDYYTGKGWVTSGSNRAETVDPNKLNQYLPLQLYGKAAEVQPEKATIVMSLKSFPQLLYGGELLNVSGVGNLTMNTSSGKLEPLKSGRLTTVKKYTMTYDYPTFVIPKLKSDPGNDPQAIKDEYLQLPSSVPQRVKDLAVKITQGKTNRYDKAEAIVSYFQQNGYVYDTKNVAKPKGNQDYVDQFLFDTKRGYCDNFSSSMVVLLRSVGIPARWVKGFTQGEYQGTNSNGKNIYKVKNSNAHSWVEVYFPNSGWVPFEPTVSFSNLTSFQYSTNSAQSTPVSATPQTPKQQPQTQKQQHQQHAKGHSNGPNISYILKGIAHFFASKLFLYILIGFMILIVLFVFVAFRTRYKWLPRYILRRFKNREDDRAFDEALGRLFWLLEKYGLVNSTGQTMREYAIVVDGRLGTSEMKQLVANYEKRRYAGDVQNNDWTESKELWENIINNLRVDK